MRSCLLAICSTNRCESMKSKVLYPPKTGQKLSIRLVGGSGGSRRPSQACNRRLVAPSKDAGDAAPWPRPGPELAAVNPEKES